MTTQITLFKEKYYPHKCAYCGKGFEKKNITDKFTVQLNVVIKQNKTRQQHA